MEDLHFEDLRREVEHKHLLIVVGTGVSLAATGNNPNASWAGLLRHGANYCNQLAVNLPLGGSCVC